MIHPVTGNCPRMRLGTLIAILLPALLLAGPARAELTASVDRTLVSDQDLVTLTVRASNETADQAVDFTGLERDFDIVSNSTRQSSSMEIINGRTTSTVHKDYTLTLAPKRRGSLTIPAFRAGSATSQPINIRVQELTSAEKQRMNRFVFFETSVDTNETYVQGQIIYSVKLFYTEAIGGDFPQPPVFDNAVVETIENEKRYESVVDGRRYYVLEKRYAIFPQRSGDLVIPREIFSGTRGRGGFFAQAQRVSATSESHTVRVKTIPDSFSGDTWIPARALGIRESWESDPPVFRVGEPVNRRLVVSAIGISDTLLPQFDTEFVEDAKIYADPPTTEKRVGADGITALQSTTIGIVPTREGELTLPEIRIPWWNTQTDREEVAVIPAATYKVLPAQGISASAPTVEVPVSQLSQPQVIQTQANPWWQWVAIGLMLLWAFSTWQWLAVRRQLKVLQSEHGRRYEAAVFEDPDEAREYRALKQACTRNQASETHRQLFLWSRARYPDVESVGQLAQRYPELKEEISRLEQHLYSAGEPGSWRGKGLIEAVDQVRAQKEKRTRAQMLAQELNPV